MRGTGRFLLRFIAAVGLLFWLWSGAGLADWYARLVAIAVGAFSPIATGYRFELVIEASSVTGAFIAEGSRAGTEGTSMPGL